MEPQPHPFSMSDPIRKVIVTGSKDWSDYDRIEAELKMLRGLHGRSILVLSNGHLGAEALAVRAAHSLGLGSHVYAPLYSKYGRPALPRAHQRLIDNNHPGIGWLFIFADKATRDIKDLSLRCIRAGIAVTTFSKEGARV